MTLPGVMRVAADDAAPSRAQVWRIDVGLSRGVLGAGPQVLEIDGDEVRVLQAP